MGKKVRNGGVFLTAKEGLQIPANRAARRAYRKHTGLTLPSFLPPPYEGEAQVRETPKIETADTIAEAKNTEANLRTVADDLERMENTTGAEAPKHDPA